MIHLQIYNVKEGPFKFSSTLWHFGIPIELANLFTSKGSLECYRHSSIYAVYVGTQMKNRRSKNSVNLGYLVVIKGRKMDRIINCVKSKITKIETAEIKECLYFEYKSLCYP